MTGFTKLFSSIVHSTVWREEMHVKVVWITMLAMADRNGVVFSSLPGLADAARVSLPQCEDALEHFLAPDPYSRTKEFEGRRIIVCDGGWLCLNYMKYRKLASDDERRIAVREAVAKHRRNHPVISGNQSKHIAEAEAEAEAKKKPSRAPRSDVEPADFAAAMDAYPKRSGGNPRSAALRAWRARLAQFGPAEGALMAAGTLRYAAWLRSDGKEGTRYVQQAKTFYGHDRHYAELWDAPSEEFTLTLTPEGDPSPESAAALRRAFGSGR